MTHSRGWVTVTSLRKPTSDGIRKQWYTGNFSTSSENPQLSMYLSWNIHKLWRNCPCTTKFCCAQILPNIFENKNYYHRLQKLNIAKHVCQSKNLYSLLFRRNFWSYQSNRDLLAATQNRNFIFLLLSWRWDGLVARIKYLSTFISLYTQISRFCGQRLLGKFHTSHTHNIPTYYCYQLCNHHNCYSNYNRISAYSSCQRFTHVSSHRSIMWKQYKRLITQLAQTQKTIDHMMCAYISSIYMFYKYYAWPCNLFYFLFIIHQHTLLMWNIFIRLLEEFDF